MEYQLPAAPPTGVVVDNFGITWRRNVSETWDPDPCPTCRTHLAGGLPWSELLAARGPLADPPPASST